MDIKKQNFLPHVEANLDALLKYPYLKIDKDKIKDKDYDLLYFYLDACKEAKKSGRKIKKDPFFFAWLWFSIDQPTYDKIHDILRSLPERLKFRDFDLQKIRQRYKKNTSIMDSWFSWKIYKMPALKDLWEGDWFPRWYKEYHKPSALEDIKMGLKKNHQKRKIQKFISNNPGKTPREIRRKFTLTKSEIENIL